MHKILTYLFHKKSYIVQGKFVLIIQIDFFQDFNPYRVDKKIRQLLKYLLKFFLNNFS